MEPPSKRAPGVLTAAASPGAPGRAIPQVRSLPASPSASQISASAVRPAVPSVKEIEASLSTLCATRLPIFLSPQQFAQHLSRWTSLYRQAKYQYVHNTCDETRGLFRNVSRSAIRQFCDCTLAHDNREFLGICVSYIKLFKDPQPFIKYMETHSIGQRSELYFVELGQFIEFNLGDKARALRIYEQAISNPKIDGTRRLQKNRSRILRELALAGDSASGQFDQPRAATPPRAPALAGHAGAATPNSKPAGAELRADAAPPPLSPQARANAGGVPRAKAVSAADASPCLSLPGWLSIDELHLMGVGEARREELIRETLGEPLLVEDVRRRGAGGAGSSASAPAPARPGPRALDPYRLVTKSEHFLSFIFACLNPRRGYIVYHVSGPADNPTAVHLRTPYYLPRVCQKFGRFYPSGQFNTIRVRDLRKDFPLATACPDAPGGSAAAEALELSAPAGMPDASHARVDFGLCPAHLFAPPLNFIEEADMLPTEPREGDTAVISVRDGALAMILTLEASLGSGAFGKVFQATLEQQPMTSGLGAARGFAAPRQVAAKVAVKFFTRKKDMLDSETLLHREGASARAGQSRTPAPGENLATMGFVGNTFVREVYALAVLRERLPFLPIPSGSPDCWPEQLRPETIKSYSKHITGLCTGLVNVTGLGALIMDYVPGLSLYHCIKRNLGYSSSSRAPFEDHLMLRFSIDMVESVIFTVSRDIVNTDIKIDNWIIAGYTGGDVYAPAPEKKPGNRSHSRSRSRASGKSAQSAPSAAEGTGPDSYYLVMCDLGKAVDAQLYITLDPAAVDTGAAPPASRGGIRAEKPPAGSSPASADIPGVTRPLHFSRESLTCIVPCPACTQETGWLFEPDLAGLASCIYMLVVGRSLKPDCIGTREPVSPKEAGPPGARDEYFVRTAAHPRLWDRYRLFEEVINRLLSWKCDQSSYEGQKVACLRFLAELHDDLQRSYAEEMRRRHPAGAESSSSGGS